LEQLKHAGWVVWGDFTVVLAVCRPARGCSPGRGRFGKPSWRSAGL